MRSIHYEFTLNLTNFIIVFIKVFLLQNALAFDWLQYNDAGTDRAQVNFRVNSTEWRIDHELHQILLQLIFFQFSMKSTRMSTCKPPNNLSPCQMQFHHCVALIFKCEQTKERGSKENKKTVIVLYKFHRTQIEFVVPIRNERRMKEKSTA